MALSASPLTEGETDISSITFSITVPIGSYHPLLEKCLASLAVQSVPLEVAVLDASNDERVRRLVERFDSVVTWKHHGPDDGQSDAIEQGWSHTTGEILGWLNADDILAPDALSHALRAFQENPETDVVYGHSLICDDDGFINGYHWNVMPPGDQILTTCCISQPSCFFRRSTVLRAGGLDRSLHYTMDWDLWIRMFQSGARFELNENIRSLVLWSQDAKTGGFGRQRRRELKRIIDQNQNRRKRFHGYLGFATQYVYEYVLPRPVRNWIWRRNVSGGNGLFGMSVAGEIVDTAFFRVFHYQSDRVRRLELKTTAEKSEFEVRMEGQVLNDFSREGAAYLFDLPQAFPSGTTMELTLESRSGSAVQIGGFRFVP